MDLLDKLDDYGDGHTISHEAARRIRELEAILAEVNNKAAMLKLERGMLLDMSSLLDEHPEGYNGPCLCKLCCSYGD